MSLKKLTVSGYKAYREDATFDVRPLTLVYGENSSGKSSLIRLLPLLKGTFDDPRGSFPFKLDSTITKSATIGDLFSKFKANNTISITLELDSRKGLATVRYEIHRFHRDIAVVLSFSACIGDGTEISVELDLEGLQESDLISKVNQRYVNVKTGKWLEGLSFDGLTPRYRGADPVLSADIWSCRSALADSRRCYWVGPLRAPVNRIERLNPSVRQVAVNGEGASQVLYADYAMNGPIFPEVSNWFLKNFNVSLDVLYGAQEFGSLASLALVRLGDEPVRIPFEDAGEGMSQVLPVLVLAAMAAHGKLGRNPIVVIEHPDLHLHSNAHFGIIDYLVSCMKKPSQPRFIVESHSESILTASQLAIIDRRLAADNFIAYHVSTESDGAATANAIHFDENGNAKNQEFLSLDWFSLANNKAMELAKKLIVR